MALTTPETIVIVSWELCGRLRKNELTASRIAAGQANMATPPNRLSTPRISTNILRLTSRRAAAASNAIPIIRSTTPFIRRLGNVSIEGITLNYHCAATT